ncbi:Predicted O-methyltransferase YrrM [Amycolatopsis arida]|uniref:Predicted O-methyltransferase YrrM n=1 Tax=Amycolatopsis arida TaxID=587909 RepID=A0A1I5WHH9_9PSEU|nr:O-methyltransferase [Amycolatopsis arida]TDX92284.1 putative O-methyltransferase YrrM [Amycolatopsis arida]SFQ19135.1 Predicted O-methyltransferase YrrM [Amycolatopsis arida]
MTSETHLTGVADGGELVEGCLPDDEALVTVRTRAAELGCAAVDPACGGVLSFLAAALRARAVVEVGTGAGVSGLYLLRGMVDDGVLTSIDLEPEHQRAARASFVEAGFPPGRTRLILGRALDVLPRLTSGGYDLVFVDAALVEYPGYATHGVQLLRPGGVIVFHNVPGVPPARRDPEALALREVARAVREDERLVPTLLPVGTGLLLAAAVR